MAKVFISYRRSESLKDSSRIYDYLSDHLPDANVFKDVHSISKGDDFRTVIRKALWTTDAVLVLISPKWLSMRLGNGTRRLEDPGDYVRLEVQSALERAGDCLVIPVLLNGARMPAEAELPEVLRSLAFLNAEVIRTDSDFLRDMQAIVERIRDYCGETEEFRVPSREHIAAATAKIDGATIS
jgi:hypothetical protein